MSFKIDSIACLAKGAMGHLSRKVTFLRNEVRAAFLHTSKVFNQRVIAELVITIEKC